MSKMWFTFLTDIVCYSKAKDLIYFKDDIGGIYSTQRKINEIFLITNLAN